MSDYKIVSLCIGLVHNNNPIRNKYIQPKIDSLYLALSTMQQVYKIDVSFQNKIQPHNTLMAISRDINYLKLFIKWHRYRLLNPLKLPFYLLSFLKRSILKYVLQSKTTGKRWRRNSAIEVAVTDKHIRVWTAFLDTNSDWLICFEDDAVFKECSIKNIQNLLHKLAQINSNELAYVDLAGGCDLSQLKVHKLQINHDNGFTYYKKPVTNTACVYMINRALAIEFYNQIIQNPEIRLNGIDWMMNSLFTNIEKHYLNTVCMHSNPSIFKHGTTTGDYISWQANTANE